MADDFGFWPPPEFLTNYDLLMDKPANTTTTHPNLISCLAATSSALGSPVESILDSTESESDEEDLLAGLTRHLSRSTLHDPLSFSSAHQAFEKSWVKCGSPKSTLARVGSCSGGSTGSSNGSPNGPSLAPSPPTSPLGINDNSWDLIYRAAGHVARMKTNGALHGGKLGHPHASSQFRSSQVHPNLRHSTGLYFNQRLPHTTISQINHVQGFGLGQAVKPQRRGISQPREGWLPQGSPTKAGDCLGGGCFQQTGKCCRQVGYDHAAWPGLYVQSHGHNHLRQVRTCGSVTPSGLLGCSDVGSLTKERNGTGVFLPRCYNTLESRKKQGCPTSSIPSKDSPHPNKTFKGINAQNPYQPQLCSNGSLTADLHLLIAQRDRILLAQQRKQQIMRQGNHHDVCLPQEWTY